MYRVDLDRTAIYQYADLRTREVEISTKSKADCTKYVFEARIRNFKKYASPAETKQLVNTLSRSQHVKLAEEAERGNRDELSR